MTFPPTWKYELLPACFLSFLCDLMHLACYCLLTLVHCYLILPFTLYIPSLLMLPSADEDNDDVIESFWLYIFSVFPSFVYYYLYSIQYTFSIHQFKLQIYIRIYSFFIVVNNCHFSFPDLCVCVVWGCRSREYFGC